MARLHPEQDGLDGWVWAGGGEVILVKGITIGIWDSRSLFWLTSATHTTFEIYQYSPWR